MFIDKLEDQVNKHNNTYHNRIKMRPLGVKDNTYIDFGKENNNKDPKSEFGDYIRISKNKNVFVKDILLIGLKNFLWLKN